MPTYIQVILGKISQLKGVDGIQKLSFKIETPDGAVFPVRFEAQIDQLEKRVDGDRKQARRTAWRQLKHLVEAQIELVENGVRGLHEVFMADILVPDGEGGQDRLADRFSDTSGERLLGQEVISMRD
jgi:hypothetical protein